MVGKAAGYATGVLGKGINRLGTDIDLIDRTEVGPKVSIYDPRNFSRIADLDAKMEADFNAKYPGRISISDLTPDQIREFLNEQFVKHPELRQYYDNPSEILNQVEANIDSCAF